MREIEFRAFCKSLNRMLSFEHLKEATRGMVDVANNEMQKRELKYNKLAPYGLFLPLEDDDLIFMQYTGLTDKNGTKIFEGDIVEMHYFFENHDPSTLGVFEDENYIKGYLIYDKLGLVLIDKNHDKYRVSDYVQEPCEELEVIGNIYDNPELLEGL